MLNGLLDQPYCVNLDSPDIHRNTPAAARSPLVRIPSSAIAAVLDQGRASAVAAHLIAIKASKGPRFVLNEHHCRLHHGVKRDAFQAGIRLAKASGALRRRRQGRKFATEQPLAESGRYILMSESILAERSALVGFVAAICLATGEVRPKEAAARVGITSPATIRKLTEAALATGDVIERRGARGTIVLARRGYVFDLANSSTFDGHPVKISAVIKSTTHLSKEVRATKNTDSHKGRGSSSRDGNCGRAVADAYATQGWAP